MMTIDDSTYWVCVDCLVLIANGDTPPELDEEQTAEYLAKVKERTPDGHYWAVGDGEHDPFAWLPCECCGSKLAGERHPAVLLAP